VTHGVLRAAHVQVNGHPVLQQLLIAELLVILGVDIAHIVPGRTGGTGHGRGLSGTLDAMGIILLPLGSIFQRCLTVFALVVLQHRQNHRQLLIGDKIDFAILGVHAGNRLAPIALAGKYPLPEVIVHLPAGNAHLFQLAGDGLLGLLHGQTGELLGIDQAAALAQIILLFKGTLGHVPSLNHLNHGNIVGNGILKITLVVAGDCHYRTGAVACQHEVTNEHRHLLAVDRVNGIHALQRAAGLALVQLGAIHVALFDGFVNVSLHFFLIFHSVHQILDNLAVRSQHHKSDAVNGFNTGGVDGEVAAAHQLEIYFHAGRLANPVALDFLGGSSSFSAKAGWSMTHCIIFFFTTG